MDGVDGWGHGWLGVDEWCRRARAGLRIQHLSYLLLDVALVDAAAIVTVTAAALKVVVADLIELLGRRGRARLRALLLRFGLAALLSCATTAALNLRLLHLLLEAGAVVVLAVEVAGGGVVGGVTVGRLG